MGRRGPSSQDSGRTDLLPQAGTLRADGLSGRVCTLTDLQLPLYASLASLPKHSLGFVVLCHDLHELARQHGVLQQKRLPSDHLGQLARRKGQAKLLLLGNSDCNSPPTANNCGLQWSLYRTRPALPSLLAATVAACLHTCSPVHTSAGHSSDFINQGLTGLAAGQAVHRACSQDHSGKVKHSRILFAAL